MMDFLSQLSSNDLNVIAFALRSGRIVPPFTSNALQRFVSRETAVSFSQYLNEFTQNNFSIPQITSIMDLLIKDRSQRVIPEEIIDLVTTGPEAGTTTNRDTGVVVRELFANAKQSVLIAGYAVYQGQKVFQALADRMQTIPELKVQMFLDVHRPMGDVSTPMDVVHKFVDRFRCQEWPQDRPFPTVFYYPLSIENAPEKRACLHAKCVVVDEDSVFVSSANFTEAAQNRNIEVGLLIHSRHLAKKIVYHFESLVEHGFVKSVI